MEDTGNLRGRMALDEETRFEELFRRYHRQVHAYCARRSAPDVSDLVADVFLVAWRKIHDVPPGEAALFWLYGVASRVLNRRWRTYKRRGRAIKRLGNLVELDSDAPAEVVVVQRHEYQLVREAASRLRTIDQEILRLTLWAELTHQETAKCARHRVGAVQQRAHRARRRLGIEYRRLVGDHAGPPLLGKEAPQ